MSANSWSAETVRIDMRERVQRSEKREGQICLTAKKNWPLQKAATQKRKKSPNYILYLSAGTTYETSGLDHTVHQQRHKCRQWRLTHLSRLCVGSTKIPRRSLNQALRLYSSMEFESSSWKKQQSVIQLGSFWSFVCGNSSSVQNALPLITAAVVWSFVRVNQICFLN